MSELLLTRDLIAAGIEHSDLRRRTHDGALHRLRRGAYAGSMDRTLREEHLLRSRASIELADSDSVLSFGSAAVLHGLPVPRDAIDRVHLTRSRNSSGRIKAGTHVHVATLEMGDVMQLDGLPVTTLDRTFVDLARSTDLKAAVAAGDVALADGLDLLAVVAQLERAKRRRRVSTARQAAHIIDSRSGSVGESYSRVIMRELGLPVPELQVEFDGPDGFLAVVDFYWHEFGLIGEFDGRVKYGRLVLPGEDPGDAVFREKQREDRLREMGFVVVRWVWDDLFHPERLAARIRRAIDLARSK